MDKFMTDANERHEKEIAKIKEEAKEKCQQQVIKSKKDVMLMSEKEHKENTRLKKELEQVEKRYQNQLVRVNQFNELYHKTLTTTKEELSQVNAFHQEQVTKAQQAHDLESQKHHRELAQITEIVQEQSKELDEARQQLTEFRTKNLDELEKIKKEADDNIQKQLWEKLKAEQEADQTKQKVGAMVEKCKVAEMRVTELEKQLGESLTASEKLKLDFAQLMTTKNHMESKELEEMISIATKENDELKKKYQDVEEELKQAYAYSSKQKSELESKLAAANEECKKTSELKSKALKECVQLKAEDELNKSEIKKLNQRLIAMTEQCKKDKLDFEAKTKPLFATPSFSKQQQQKSNPPVNADTSQIPKNSALSDTQSWRRRQLNDRLASCPTSASTNMPINICVNTSNTFNYAPLNIQPQTGWALARGPFDTHKRVSACSPAGPSRFAKFSRRNENEQPRSGLQMDQQLYEFCKNTCERNNGNPFGPNNQSHLPTGNNIYSAHELNYRESRHPRPFGSFCNSGRGRMF
uniref:Uncharacterized protein n=1 Tax=Ditylenchus dipsaci TaxID=166011 RepID=A0A915E5L7_9BILA